MSNSNFPRRAVDEAIDRAVRDLMQIDPRPGLRRRVLTRIERVSSGAWVLGSVGPWVGRSRASTVLFPATALIAIVAALIIPALRERPIEVTQSPAPLALPAPSASSRSAVPTPSESASPAPLQSAPAPSERAVRRSQRAVATATFDPRRDRVTATSLRPPVTGNDEAAGILDALRTISPLPTETAAPAPLALTALQIQPLHLQALAPRR